MILGKALALTAGMACQLPVPSTGIVSLLASFVGATRAVSLFA
jgi:hypothetical protein